MIKNKQKLKKKKPVTKGQSVTIGFDPTREDIEVIIRPVVPGQTGKFAMTYLGPGGGGGGGSGLPRTIVTPPGAGYPPLGGGGCGYPSQPAQGTVGGPLRGEFHSNDPNAGAGMASGVVVTGGCGNQTWQVPPDTVVSTNVPDMQTSKTDNGVRGGGGWQGRK